VKKVHWGETAGLGNKYDDMTKFVEELQERMERMEKEMGDLRDENQQTRGWRISIQIVYFLCVWNFRSLC